jgi:hypothetical protein
MTTKRKKTPFSIERSFEEKVLQIFESNLLDGMKMLYENNPSEKIKEIWENYLSNIMRRRFDHEL